MKKSPTKNRFINDISPDQYSIYSLNFLMAQLQPPPTKQLDKEETEEFKEPISSLHCTQSFTPQTFHKPVSTPLYLTSLQSLEETNS